MYCCSLLSCYLSTYPQTSVQMLVHLWSYWSYPIEYMRIVHPMWKYYAHWLCTWAEVTMTINLYTFCVLFHSFSRIWSAMVNGSAVVMKCFSCFWAKQNKVLSIEATREWWVFICLQGHKISSLFLSFTSISQHSCSGSPLLEIIHRIRWGLFWLTDNG